MKENLKIYFLKLRRYFLLNNNEKFFIIIIFLSGLIIVFLSYWTLKKNLPLKPVFGGVYREGLYEEIESLSPFYPKNESQKAILNIVFPSLIEFDNGKVISKFLKNYSFSSDALTYNFELKEGLKWSNGDTLTSEDVAFGFKMLKRESSPEIAGLFKDVELEVVDNRNFILRLKTNNNYLFYNLKYLKPLPQKILIQNEIKFPDFLKIGSGPFVLDSFLKNDNVSYLILRRNDYYQFKPYFDKVIFVIYPSVKRAFDGLFLKEIDGLAGVNYFNLPSNLLINYKVYKITLPRIIGLFANSKKISSEEIEFLEKNIDKNFLVKNIFNGYAEKSESIFSPTIRRLLDLNNLNFEIGNIKNSNKNLTITTISSYFYPEIARYLRDKFNFNIEFVDNKDLQEKINNKDYEIILTGLNFSHPPYLASFFSLAGFNLNNVENIELEKRFQKLVNDLQINWSQELFEIEKRILSLKSNVFLLNPYYLYFLNKNIYNFNEFYIFDPAARFVKIEYWFKK